MDLLILPIEERVWHSEWTIYFSFVTQIYAWTALRSSLGTWWGKQAQHKVVTKKLPRQAYDVAKHWWAWSVVWRTQALEADLAVPHPSTLPFSSVWLGRITWSFRGTFLICKLETVMLVHKWSEVILPTPVVLSMGQMWIWISSFHLKIELNT